MIQIIAFKGEGIFDRIIRKFTKSDYSHVAMIRDGKQIEARWDAGVRIVPVNTHAPCEVELFDFSEQLRFDEELAIWDKALLLVGKKYDYAGILAYALRLYFLQKPSAYFCSELVVECCRPYRMIVPAWMRASEASPVMVARSSDLKLTASYRIGG